ncbi:uncharacterized protein TNCV_3232521 [Trichonephila clavipes]|nr:uncharacterized protein TNCV_3232521 [Trichonephila clavipes]
MLNDDEIVTSVLVESDPVDDEMDEDEDNNVSSKGPSNADAFSALEAAMEWYRQQSKCCPTQLVLLKKENQRPCSEKTKVYNCTAKNKRLFSTRKLKLRHFAPILLFLQAHFPHMMTFDIRIVSGFIYCMDSIRFSVIRTIAYPNGVQSQLIQINNVLLFYNKRNC